LTSDEVYDKFDDVLMLDSKTDVADREAVEEFRNEIKQIINQEINAKSPENKKKIEQQLEEFIVAQSKEI
jgi:GTP1/Obg family GTP-binding protein